MIYASEQLQILAKKYSVAVICLSQASMSEVTKPVIDRNPNESFMIRATADTFINI
jgi:replicative DNA helicase